MRGAAGRLPVQSATQSGRGRRRAHDENGDQIPDRAGSRERPRRGANPRMVVAMAARDDRGSRPARPPACSSSIRAGQDKDTGEDVRRPERASAVSDNEIGAAAWPDNGEVDAARRLRMLYFATRDADIGVGPGARPSAIGNRIDMIHRFDVRGDGGYVIAPLPWSSRRTALLHVGGEAARRGRLGRSDGR